MTSLDATAGEKKWPEQADIRIDIAPRSPDVIRMDATDLKFPDAYFDEIYFHPPYCINPGRLRLLGRWAFFFRKKEWRWFLVKTLAEFNRCLKPYGKLIYNVDEGRFYGMAHYKDVIGAAKFFGFEVEKDEKTPVTKPMGDTFRHILTLTKTE